MAGGVPVWETHGQRDVCEDHPAAGRRPVPAGGDGQGGTSRARVVNGANGRIAIMGWGKGWGTHTASTEGATIWWGGAKGGGTAGEL